MFNTYIADSRRRIAEDHHSWTVVVVHQGPEITAGADDRPLGDDVLPGVSVALREVLLCNVQAANLLLLTSTKTALM